MKFNCLVPFACLRRSDALRESDDQQPRAPKAQCNIQDAPQAAPTRLGTVGGAAAALAMPPRRSIANAFGKRIGLQAPAQPRRQAAAPALHAIQGTAGDVKVTALVARLAEAGVPDDQRARIGGRLRLMPGPVLQREIDLLQHALGSPNADRAVGTYDRLHSLVKDRPGAASRLTPEMREVLVRGVADRSSMSDKGLKGVIGQRHADEIARALIAMPRADYDRLSATLDRAGRDPQGHPARGADPHTERALILKVVGARADRVAGDTSARRQTMDKVMEFAAGIRGMDRQALVFNTTALDIVEGMGSVKPGLGLANYQRYSNTCAVANAQTVRAEWDPLVAAALRADFFEEGSPTQRQQKEVYERRRFMADFFHEVSVAEPDVERWLADGTLPPGILEVSQGAVVDPIGEQVEKEVIPVLEKNLPPETFRTVLRYATNHLLSKEEDEKMQADVGHLVIRKAFNMMRKNVETHPLKTLLDRMRFNYVRDPDGTTHPQGYEGGPALWECLADISPAPAGREWTIAQTNGADGPADWGTGGLNESDIRELEAVLKTGSDVPITIASIYREDGQLTASHAHTLLISDVRGEGDGTKYLVTDPSHGRTEWVLRSEMRDHDSGWPKKYFLQRGKAVHELFYDRHSETDAQKAG